MRGLIHLKTFNSSSHTRIVSTPFVEQYIKMLNFPHILYIIYVYIWLFLPPSQRRVYFSRPKSHIPRSIERNMWSVCFGRPLLQITTLYVHRPSLRVYDKSLIYFNNDRSSRPPFRNNEIGNLSWLKICFSTRPNQK